MQNICLFLECEILEPITIVDTLEGEDSMSNASEVEELKSLMNVENFSVDNDRFSIENLRSLKADDCFCLFNHALNKNHSEIALRLLLLIAA
jgi:hypothetical protein